MTSDEDDISELAMSIMGSVAYGGPLPRRVTHHELTRLSDYECLVIDKAIRNRGLRLSCYAPDDEMLIERADKD